MLGAIFALGLARAHHCLAHFVHHCAYIGEIKINQTRTHHKVSYTLYALVQHIVCHAESFGKGGFLIRKAEQILVWNNDQCVDHFLQRFNARFGLTHALGAFELERFCDNANG